jgi:hypothetical protein
VINCGRFQELGRKAVATPGSLYFTYWLYPNAQSQRPAMVQQGLLEADKDPAISSFDN